MGVVSAILCPSIRWCGKRRRKGRVLGCHLRSEGCSDWAGSVLEEFVGGEVEEEGVIQSVDKWMRLLRGWLVQAGGAEWSESYRCFGTGEVVR